MSVARFFRVIGKGGKEDAEYVGLELEDEDKGTDVDVDEASNVDDDAAESE